VSWSKENKVPNGGSWDRFCFVLLGFYGEFGRWPTRMVAPRVVLDTLAAHLSPSDLAKVNAKLEVVLGEELVAQDAAGREYRYVGPPERPPIKDVQEWLGIMWD
jgi:hypothetical protein